MKKISRSVPLSDYVRILITSAIIVVCDQLTKLMVVATFYHGETRQVIPGFFDVVLVFNKGAAFGMLGGLSEDLRRITLAATTVLAVGTIIYLLFSEYINYPRARVALGLIIGGAIGNIIDRIRFGQVVDFLDFYVRDVHWPAFNVADSAICIGVGLLLITSPKPETSSSVVSTTNPECPL